MTAGCGRLPEPGELVAQLEAAGFVGMHSAQADAHRELLRLRGDESGVSQVGSMMTNAAETVSTAIEQGAEWLI